MKLKLRKYPHLISSARFCQILLALLLVLLSSVGQAGVVSCKDQQGNVFFTDNPSLCTGDRGHALVLKTNTKNRLAGKSKADYRTPKREYQKAHSDWTIYLETSLTKGDEQLANNALTKLDKNLNEIFARLPSKPARKLQNLSFYLMWGDNSPYGGRASGMSYIRNGEPKNYTYLDPRWNHVIIIYSATNLMYLDEVWTKKALMHEVAHAWHITNWPDKYEPIYNAYLNAKDSGLYLGVSDNKGKVIPKAYAMKNQLEYFAELSAIYFVGGNYHPYNSIGLTKYDEQGYALIEALW